MARTCSVARALDILGEKWSLLVIREALLGETRFNYIQANTGAPRDILSDRLHKLVASDVLERVQYEEHPPRYEYRLSPAGRELSGAITLLREWGDRHCGEPPAIFEHTCGHRLQAKLVCAACGEEVTSGSTRRIPGARDVAQSRD